MRREYRLTLPLVASLNKAYSANSWQRAAIAGEAHATIGWHIKREYPNIEALPGPVIVNLTAFGPRPYDPDNICKLLLDGLVKAGVLQSDDWRYIHTLTLQSRKSSKQDARIEVHITQVVD